MVPPGAEIVRAFGLDIARHVAIAGRYPTWLATPDRWNMWGAAAFIAGLRCIRRFDPAVIWATFPIASALFAAISLRRVTRIPLIVDLRDPLVYENWPENRWTRATHSKIEKQAVSLASAVVVTTPGARRLYIERYPHLPMSRFRIIANGVDDTTEVPAPNSRTAWSEPIVLVHSGLMEIPDRDPAAFFEAVAQMRKQGAITNNILRVTLRATGRDDAYRRQIAAFGVDDIITIESRISHADALDEMRRADGLILFQGAQCNRQIPAKAYEYLACRRPIIGLVDSMGDTYQLIANEWQVPYVANLNSAPAIADVLQKFINDYRRREVFVPASRWIEKHSRTVGANQLAELFDDVSRESANA